jgi:hypothetical protein
MVIQAANARWMELAQQAAMKQGGMPPPSAGPAGPGANPGTSPFAPSPVGTPTASSLPGIAAQPMVTQQETAVQDVIPQ